VCTSGNKDYICEQVNNCGARTRDSTFFHLWASTSHPVVVVLDYNSILKHGLDEQIDLLLADQSLKGFYIKTPPHPVTGESSVDTGFMMIKPSEEEFEKIMNAYVDTPFDAVNGWNGQGKNNFKGCLGIASFLLHYFSNNNEYVELDRCTYAHSAEEDCLSQVDITSCKGGKIYDKVCGNPRNCPYDHPDWSAAKKEACATLHKNCKFPNAFS
jgi:hypothetical protein